MEQQLCINIFEGIDRNELYPLVKEAGFDGFFTNPEWADDLPLLKEVRSATQALGLFQETVHATIKGADDMWLPGPAGDEFAKTMCRNIDHCVAIGVPLIVMHPQLWKKEPDIPLGLGRFERVVRYAEKEGVRIAFENVDSAPLLHAVMGHFTDSHVGFCYDNGHELFLMPEEDFLARYGNRLFCIHLHDNDGTWDGHLLPYDGKAPYERTIRELAECGFAGPVSLEVRMNEKYREAYTKEAFVARCHEIAGEIRDRIGQAAAAAGH